MIRFIVKRIALFVAMLLAVNAATYLVTNYLQLRGPMAYNYVPDTRVSIAEVFAPYPDYLRGIMMRGDLGAIGLWRRSGEKTPILKSIVAILPRSLVLLGIDEHLILPILALSARPTAEIARLTAELLGEELPKEYIRTARAKGLPERVIVMHHAFRNVAAAVINAMSNSWSYLIGSLVIVEIELGEYA